MHGFRSYLSGFKSYLSDLKVKRLQYFLIGCKQICPIFAPDGDIIFIILNSKQIFPFLWRETLAPSFKAVLSTYILEKTV